MVPDTDTGAGSDLLRTDAPLDVRLDRAVAEPPATGTHPALAEELVGMAVEDHRLSHRANSEAVAEQLVWRRLTARNGDRLNEIMAAHGWPGHSLVGERAATAAWLIALHADRQLDVQRRALRLMDRAVAAGEASPREAAFLRDRTLVNEGRKQIYGTRIRGTENGTPVPWPCAEPDRVDALRAEVGIEPFAAYTGRFSA